MRFEHRATVPVSRPVLWDFIMQIEQVAACVPGASGIVQEGDDTYAGTVRVRVGPIALALQGRLVVTQRSREEWRATMRGEGSDRKVGGAVRADMGIQLLGQDGASSEIFVYADVAIMGKLGEFGQPLIRKKADQIMAEFTDNLRKAVLETEGARAG